MAEDELHHEDDQTGNVDPEKLPVHNAPDFRTIYTNMVGVNSSIFDFSLTACEIIDGAALEKKVRLAMSPQLAKALMLSMINQVKTWERAFGKINIGSDIVR